MNRYDPLRIWIVLLVATSLLVVVCIWLVDRPVAQFVATHLPTEGLRKIFDPIFRVLGGVFLLVLAAMFVCGLRVATGGQPHPAVRVPLLCSAAGMWSLATEVILKQLFGRLNPDIYFAEGLYLFRLLHGFVNIDAFPSGTAMTVSTVTAVLWLEMPRLRIPAVILSVFLCFSTIISNRHWVGDLIGGAFLGATIGWLTVKAYAALRVNRESTPPL